MVSFLLNTHTSKERTPQVTYHYLTIDELTMIANFRDQGVKAYRAAKLLHRSLETVYRVYRFLAAGHTLQEYCQHYRKNKAHCGRKAIQLPTDEATYIKLKAGRQTQSWDALNDHSAVVCGRFTAFLSGVPLMCGLCR